MLAEASLYERLRRRDDVVWDPHISHAALIYDDTGAALLADIHRQYIAVARAHGLPMLVGAATWRANAERIARSRFHDRPVNADNVAFVRSLAEQESSANAPPLFVSAVLGPAGDAYRPEQGLDAAAAERFHAPQVAALAEARPDVLLAATLPALVEARGIARLLDATGLPYILSFVVSDRGALLDGTPLARAFDTIDSERSHPPLGYSINCVHPAVVLRGLSEVDAATARRLIGFRGNTADKPPSELDGAQKLISEDPAVFAAAVARVHERFGLRIVGGCCGTDTAHLEYVARACTQLAPNL